LQNLQYEITGKILIDKGMIRKIPFSHQGMVDITRALAQAKGAGT